MSILPPDVVVTDWDRGEGHVAEQPSQTFSSAGLGVVRVQIAPDTFVATLPKAMADAKDYATAVKRAVEGALDYPTLIDFDAETGLPCWLRARNVLTIDVVSTEDPGA